MQIRAADLTNIDMTLLHSSKMSKKASAATVHESGRTVHQWGGTSVALTCTLCVNGVPIAREVSTPARNAGTDNIVRWDGAGSDGWIVFPLAAGATSDVSHKRQMSHQDSSGHLMASSQVAEGNMYLLRDLPISARVICELHTVKGKGTRAKKNETLGWCGFNLFSFKRHLHNSKGGQHNTLQLWPGSCPSLSVPGLTNQLDANNCGEIEVAFDAYEHDVISVDSSASDAEGGNSLPMSGSVPLTYQDRRHIETLTKKDNLYNLAGQDKAVCWQHRDHLKVYPDSLPHLLMSVQWDQRSHVMETYRLLRQWKPLRPHSALQLLDSKFSDPQVRAFAVKCLEKMPDSDVAAHMLQLAQAVTYEPFHDSALARFLLRRAVLNPMLVGHAFYWALHAESHRVELAYRLGVLREAFVRNCGAYRQDLGHQVFLMEKLEGIRNVMKASVDFDDKDSSKQAREVLSAELSHIVLPFKFQTPLDPHVRVKGIEVGKSRVMDSKMKPLWLEFNRAEEEGPAAEAAKAAELAAVAQRNSHPQMRNAKVLRMLGQSTMELAEAHKPKKPAGYKVLLKFGDDLRQDQLTLQIITFMDIWWKGSGLDLKMTPYRCVSTGLEQGMIEIVENAKTVASILSESVTSGAKGIRGAYKAVYGSKQGMLDWLVAQVVPPETSPERVRIIIQNAQNKTPSMDHTEQRMFEVLHNFASSCAGYCVATYVLGIGDRHPSNIMVTKDGRFLHIDFGHFLGNFKKKYGYAREGAPFVFTKQFAHALGGTSSRMFQTFEQLCMDAYNVVRKHANHLIMLFSLMISCGIPELQSHEDIMWLREKLLLDHTDQQAALHMRDQIKISMASTKTKFNTFCHIIKHQ